MLKILIETLVLTGFLWIGKSVMKAQVHFKSLVIAAFAGALASQVPFAGMYLSFAVVLFFMWKMARVDIVPDGVLIVVIGKGAGLIIMIYGVALLMDNNVETEEMTSLSQIPIYVDEEGKRYYAEGEQVYYFDENEEKVFADANILFGISEMMEIANKEEASTEVVETIQAVETAEPEVIENSEEETELADNSNVEGFSDPLLSDSVVRGDPLPFEIFVPRGWSVNHKSGVLAIRHEGHTYLHCFSIAEGSDNKSYLRAEVNRVLSQYSGYEVARQELVTLDGKQWARIQLVNGPGDQVLLMTHANQSGCYSIELNGTFSQLSSNKDVLNRMMFSFNFPPSTYLLAQLESEE